MAAEVPIATDRYVVEEVRGGRTPRWMIADNVTDSTVCWASYADQARAIAKHLNKYPMRTTR